MRVNNLSTRQVNLNFVDGRILPIDIGGFITLPDSDISYLDDSPGTLALFSAGVLSLTDDTGGTYSGRGLPTVPSAPTATTTAVIASIAAANSGRTAAMLGDSRTVAGMVYGATNRNGPNGYTNRDLHWLFAALERPYVKIWQYGLNGDTTRAVNVSPGIVNRLRTEVLVGPWFDDLVIFGCGHNNPANGLTIAQTLADIDTICDLTAAAKKRVIWFTDWLPDTWADSTANRTFYAQMLSYILNLPRRYAHVVVVPTHETANCKDQNITLASKSFSSDGVHPVATGVLKGMYGAAKKALAAILSPSPLPVLFNDDPYSIAANPFLKGARNCAGANQTAAFGYAYNPNGVTGVMPDAWTVTMTGASSACASSKVPHPTDPGWGAGEASAPCWKLSMTTGANTGSFVVSTRLNIAYAWSSGLAVDRPMRFLLANGILYRIVTAGNLAAGADPTATWPKTLGTKFTDGTAVLQACKDWHDGGAFIYGLVSAYFDQAVQAGVCTFELKCETAGTGNTGSSYAFYGLPNAIGTGASFGTLGGLDWLPPHLVAHTQYDPATPVPATQTQIDLTLTINLGANARQDMTLDFLGAIVLR